MSEGKVSQMEAGLQAQRAKKGAQDPKVPFLIHRDTAVLYPNVEKLRKHAKMIPFHGSVKASDEERQRYLRTGGQARRSVSASQPLEELPPFDVSTATKDELIAFARDEFGLELNPNAPIHIMRNQIVKASKEAEEADTPPAGETDLG